MHYRQPAVAHRERATGRPAARHGRPALDAAHREGRDQVPVRHADVSPTFVAATGSGRMGGRESATRCDHAGNQRRSGTPKFTGTSSLAFDPEAGVLVRYEPPHAT